MYLRNSKADEFYNIILSMIEDQAIETKFLQEGYLYFSDKEKRDISHSQSLSERASFIYIRSKSDSLLKLYVDDRNAKSYQQFFEAVTDIQKKYFCFHLDVF